MKLCGHSLAGRWPVGSTTSPVRRRIIVLRSIDALALVDSGRFELPFQACKASVLPLDEPPTLNLAPALGLEPRPYSLTVSSSAVKLDRNRSKSVFPKLARSRQIAGHPAERNGHHKRGRKNPTHFAPRAMGAPSASISS